MKFREAKNYVLTRLGLQVIDPAVMLQTYIQILAVQTILRNIKVLMKEIE